MKDVRWGVAAENQFAAWIAHLLIEAGERVANRAYAEVTSRARELGDVPEKYRTSELWENMRELPLSDWKKLLVYRVDPDVIRVVALYDQRQDLSVVNPFSK